MDKKVFTKLLVAKYSPENGCNVEDGKILTISPKKNFSKTKGVVTHQFNDSIKKSIKSKFGWVKEVEPFTINDFADKYLKKKEFDEDELEHLQVMFSAIDKLHQDTPVAAAYNRRIIDYKPKMALLVHKVKFY